MNSRQTCRAETSSIPTVFTERVNQHSRPLGCGFQCSEVLVRCSVSTVYCSVSEVQSQCYCSGILVSVQCYSMQCCTVDLSVKALVWAVTVLGRPAEKSCSIKTLQKKGNLSNPSGGKYQPEKITWRISTKNMFTESQNFISLSERKKLQNHPILPVSNSPIPQYRRAQFPPIP